MLRRRAGRRPIIAVIGILLVMAIAIVAIWQIFGTLRARMSVAREDAYRRLAEESAAEQARVGDQLARMTEELSELRTKTQELERVLKSVE